VPKSDLGGRVEFSPNVEAEGEEFDMIEGFEPYYSTGTRKGIPPDQGGTEGDMPHGLMAGSDQLHDSLAGSGGRITPGDFEIPLHEALLNNRFLWGKKGRMRHVDLAKIYFDCSTPKKFQAARTEVTRVDRKVKVTLRKLLLEAKLTANQLRIASAYWIDNLTLIEICKRYSGTKGTRSDTLKRIMEKINLPKILGYKTEKPPKREPGEIYIELTALPADYRSRRWAQTWDDKYLNTAIPMTAARRAELDGIIERTGKKIWHGCTELLENSIGRSLPGCDPSGYRYVSRKRGAKIEAESEAWKKECFTRGNAHRKRSEKFAKKVRALQRKNALARMGKVADERRMETIIIDLMIKDLGGGPMPREQEKFLWILTGQWPDGDRDSSGRLQGGYHDKDGLYCRECDCVEAHKAWQWIITYYLNKAVRMKGGKAYLSLEDFNLTMDIEVRLKVLVIMAKRAEKKHEGKKDIPSPSKCH